MTSGRQGNTKSGFAQPVAEGREDAEHPPRPAASTSLLEALQVTDQGVEVVFRQVLEGRHHRFRIVGLGIDQLLANLLLRPAVCRHRRERSEAAPTAVDLVAALAAQGVDQFLGARGFPAAAAGAAEAGKRQTRIPALPRVCIVIEISSSEEWVLSLRLWERPIRSFRMLLIRIPEKRRRGKSFHAHRKKVEFCVGATLG